MELRTVTRALKGLYFTVMLALSSVYGVLVYGGCFLPLFAVSPKMYRYHFDRMIASWEYLCIALLEVVLGVKVVITGDEIQSGERNLIIMNHRTRLDWMYFWSVLIRQSGVKTEKIILKEELKKIPGAGWAMQVGAFIFLDRVWEKDKQTLSTMLNYFSDLDHNTQVLLFPEGTDFSTRTKARSDQFAKKNDWKPYDYCLHPRTTGFTFIAQLMRDNEHLDAIYDVTVGYPYNFPHNELGLILGNVPKEVHFHVKRYPITDIAEDESGLQTWCQQRWEEKECRLQQFYKDLSFKNARHDGQSDCQPDGQSDVRAASGGGAECGPAGDARIQKNNHRGNAELMLYIALVYWTAFVVGITVILVYSSLARWLALAQVAFYLYMGHKRGGFEIFQADYYNWFFKSKTKVQQ